MKILLTQNQSHNYSVKNLLSGGIHMLKKKMVTRHIIKKRPIENGKTDIGVFDKRRLVHEFHIFHSVY